MLTTQAKLRIVNAMTLTVGNPAPDFSLYDQNDVRHSLSKYASRWLVIYFYPKDDTPGCTTEACGFRDEYAELKEIASLVGVSADDTASHREFAKKYSLPFPLLADPNKEMIKAYDAWKPKKMFGKEFWGIQRKTVIINPEGRIAHIFNSVKPDNHAAQVIKKITALKTK